MEILRDAELIDKLERKGVKDPASLLLFESLPESWGKEELTAFAREQVEECKLPIDDIVYHEDMEDELAWQVSWKKKSW